MQTKPIKSYPFSLNDGKITPKPVHKFLKVNPGEVPTVIEIEEVSYEFLREQIGGLIEYVQFQHDNQYFDIILHEEGKLEELPPSLIMMQNNVPFDFIAGGFLVAKSDEEGETIGLSDEELKRLLPLFSTNLRSVFVPKLGGIFPYITF